MAGIDYYHCAKCDKKILYIHSKENELTGNIYCGACYTKLRAELEWTDAHLFNPEIIDTQATQDFIKTNSKEAKRLLRIRDLLDKEIEHQQLQAEYDKLEIAWNKAIKQLDTLRIAALIAKELAKDEVDINRMAKQIDEQNKEIKQLREQFDCLSNLVIMHNPETWEYYLEDIKGGGVN